MFQNTYYESYNYRCKKCLNAWWIEVELNTSVSFNPENPIEPQVFECGRFICKCGYPIRYDGKLIARTFQGVTMNKHLETILANKPMEVWDMPEDNDFYLLFDPYMWDKVVRAAEEMAEQVEFWKREWELELAHTKHSEEHIVEQDKKIADLEAKLNIAIQYEIMHKIRTGQFEEVK